MRLVDWLYLNTCAQSTRNPKEDLENIVASVTNLIILVTIIFIP